MTRQRMRWSGLAGLGLLVAGLAGCGVEAPGEPRGTGLNKVLYLRGAYSAVAAGLKARVEVPGRRYFPEHVDPVDAKEEDVWDFQDATLEVEAPEGLAFEVQRAGNDTGFRARHGTYEGFILLASCNAAPGVEHEVRLRVKAPEGVRYEDAFHVTCHQPTRMETQLQDEVSQQWVPLASQRSMVGGKLRLKVELIADKPGEQVRLSGEGRASLTERHGLLRIPSAGWSQGSFSGMFEVAAPGSGPELVFGGLSAQLPLEAVADDGWQLAHAPVESSGPEVYRSWTFQARALDAVGQELLGLHGCSWRLEWGPGATHEGTGCRFSHSGNRPSRACVTALGRTSCQDAP
jgi:hypothetical protein